jgi:hypothetical protein
MTAEPPRENAYLTREALSERVDTLLSNARNGHRTVSLSELEEIYTTGCAEVLQLEAEVLRLRAQLRHVRTAIEWLQEQGDALRAL